MDAMACFPAAIPQQQLNVRNSAAEGKVSYQESKGRGTELAIGGRHTGPDVHGSTFFPTENSLGVNRLHPSITYNAWRARSRLPKSPLEVL